MLQSSKSFNLVFWFMLFGMLMGTVLAGGVLALIVHLVGGPTWLLITLWAAPPTVALALFLGAKKKISNFLKM